MKRNLLLLGLVAIFMIGCSTDNMDEGADDDTAMQDDDTTAEDGMDDTSDDTSGTTGDLVGLWTLSDIRFDETLDNDDLEFAKEIIEFLIAQECYLVTFDFMDNGMVTSESKGNYLEINAGPTGLDIPCPEESDVFTSLWSLDGDQLTFIDEGEEKETLTIVFEDENTFIIDGSAVDENNYDGGEAVFIRVEE
ncbi:MAG: hypothetical protein HRT65_15455 [Flavobacteriaceae bacterium]|nr:hypothetical protein [Flavobacteriaceae bacterium]